MEHSSLTLCTCVGIWINSHAVRHLEGAFEWKKWENENEEELCHNIQYSIENTFSPFASLIEHINLHACNLHFWLPVLCWSASLVRE